MLRAVIFDCDGIIVNSEPLHLQAFKEILADEGISLSNQDYYEKYLSMDDLSLFDAVLLEHNRPVDDRILKSLITRKMALYRRLTSRDLILYPGVVALVNKLKGRFRLAVASGAFRGEVKSALDEGGITEAFPVLVTAQDVRNGKPHPEAFQTALAKINAVPPPLSPPIKAEECLVIEDSVKSVEGAHAAGMKCAAVTNSYSRDKLARADLILDSLEGVEPEVFEKLFLPAP